MCWSVPGKITSIDGKIGMVDISGITKKVGLDLITSPAVGDFVLVHAGYAIQKVDAEKAAFTIDFFKTKGGNV